MAPLGLPKDLRSTDLFGEDHSVQASDTPIWRELGIGAEWATLRLSPVYWGMGVPRGNGDPVLLVPGFFASDVAMMSEMFWWLARLGYEPHFSQLGFNLDCPNSSTDLVLARVRRLHKETGKRVRLIGHSLGGLIARTVALEHPGAVSQLISLAAPFQDVAYIHPVLIEAMEVVRRHHGHPMISQVRATCFSGHCTCRFMARVMLRERFAVPRYSIFSEQDGLVAAASCREMDEALNIRVCASHHGMLVNAQVYREIGRLLAQPADSSRMSGDAAGG